MGVAVVALADDSPGGEHGRGAEDGATEASSADAVDVRHTQTEHSVLGDTVAIGSALCYAAYTTLLEQKLGDDADPDMLSLFAFLGAFGSNEFESRQVSMLVQRVGCDDA